MAASGKWGKVKTAAQRRYYTKDNAHEAGVELSSYYGQDGRLENKGKMLSGRWYDPHGITSKNLNNQIITEADFEHILDGRDPELIDPKTGELQRLVRNSGAKNRTQAIDVTLSPPKQVTLLWVAADENKKRLIEKIQHDAALAAVKFADENLIVTRRGAGGSVEEKAHGIYALFDHKTARPHENLIAPQLHTHCLFSGMVRAADGTMLALQEKKLMNWRSAFENFYHLELASSLREMGYEIEVEKGKTAFRIKGMEQFQDACEALSPRSKQVQKNIDEKFQGRDRKDLTREEEQIAVLHNRSSKINLAREELDSSWEKAISDSGSSTESVRKFMAQTERQALKIKQPAFSITELQIDHLREEIAAEFHETDSTIKEGTFMGRLAFKMQGQCGREDVEQMFARIKSGLAFVKVDHNGENLFASHRQVEIERELIRLAKTPTPQHVLDRGYVEKMIAARQTPELVKAGRAMTDAQAESVREMLAGNGACRLVGISQGRAGSGKSFSADTIKSCYESIGCNVHGIALGYRQAGVLKDEGKFEYTTAVAKFCSDLEQKKTILGPKSVVLIDEGGLVSSQLMLKMTQAAHAAGAKIVLTGDSLQLGAIGGEAFKTLTNALGSTVIGETAAEIRRQKVVWQAQAGLDIANQNAKAAVAAYRANGHFHIANDRGEAISAIAKNVKAHILEHPEQSRIIIANTRADVKELNKQIRAVKRDLGVITGEDHTVQCGNGKDDIYDAQLAIGDRIQFRHNGKKDQDIYNRTTAVITKIDTKHGEPVFHALLENGNTTSFSATPGDKNYDVKTQSLMIEPAHCQTLFSSQGATVDKAFVYDKANLDRLQAYVACTRHRLDLEVHFDRESLHDKIVTPDNWRSPSKLTEDEIFKNISERWTFSQDRKSTYDLMHSPEEKFADYEKTRAENQKIIASAQLAHEAGHEFKAFEQRENARQLAHKPVLEASNDLVFSTTPEYTSYEQLRAARRVSLYQSNASVTERDASSESIAGVRELPSIGMVQHEGRTEVLLHENAPDLVELVGQENGTDHSLRRTGTGDPRIEGQGSEVTDVATEAVIEQPTAEQPAVALGFPYFGPAPESALYSLIGSSPLIVTTTRENALAISKQELKANSAATTVAIENEFDDILRSPTIREAIQNPNRALVFAGDVDEKTKAAVLRISAQVPPQKTEHDYRDILHVRNERDINLPVL